MNTKPRVSKNRYYLNIAEEVSRRSTCMSSQFGCLIVRDDQIISTGYNGAPRGTKDCMELGNCLRRKLNVASGTQYELCRSVHAEQNAIINAARAGVSLLNGKIFLFGRKVLAGEEQLIKSYPCFICKKMILNSGISEVIGNDEKGEIVEYKVADWVEEWAKNDMIEDSQKYSAGYKNAGTAGAGANGGAGADKGAAVMGGCGGCCNSNCDAK
jgi:dCMP deaminase